VGRAGGPVRAIGRLAPSGVWVGIEPLPSGYRLVFGAPDGSFLADRTDDPDLVRAGLVAAAIVYFLASLAEPPGALEATQADMAALLIDLRARTTGPDRALAAEALDAVDDGLPADAVVLRLQRLLPHASPDATELLEARYRGLSGTR
jgi:hypothetical protein